MAQRRRPCGLAILALTAAAGIGVAHRPHADDGDASAEKRPHPRAGALDDDEADDEPGFGMVSIGAAIHALLTVKAALRRMACRRSKSAPARARVAAPFAGVAASARR